MNGTDAGHHEGTIMNRTLAALPMLFALGCVDTQDHGRGDDAGLDALPMSDAAVMSDAIVAVDGGLDATVAMDGALPPDGGLADSGAPIDTGIVPDSGATSAAYLYIQSTVSRGTRTRLVGGALRAEPHTRFRVRVWAANGASTSTPVAPTKTVGPCDYWPPTLSTWPPIGSSTSGESVPLELADVGVRVGGRSIELTESGGSVSGSDDYVAGARVEVTVRLASGTVVRTFDVGDTPAITEPLGAPSASWDAFLAEYIAGEPLAIRWPTTYDPGDHQSILVSGSDSALWARCSLDHGDGELVFSWADVQADFLGSSGTDGQSMNVFWAVSDVDVVDEGGVQVQLARSRSQQVLLLPPSP